MRQRLQELADERDRLKREMARVREEIAETATAARDEGMIVSDIADALRVTRTSLYDFMGRRRG